MRPRIDKEQDDDCGIPALLLEKSTLRVAEAVLRAGLARLTMAVRDEATDCSALADDMPRSHPERLEQQLALRQT